jgi:soluble lytic murein transglycosylase-like protein
MDLLSVTGLSDLKLRFSTADKEHVTWWLALFLIQDARSIRASMQASLEQQRVSVRKQAATAAARAVQWVTAPRVERACEPVPEPQLAQMIEDVAQRQGVQPSLVREVARQESAFQPCAVSVKGAEGLMQLMPSTQTQFQVRNPFDAQQSLEAGSKLLKELIERYHGDLRLALSAYNAGSTRVDQAGAILKFPKPRVTFPISWDACRSKPLRACGKSIFGLSFRAKRGICFFPSSRHPP